MTRTSKALRRLGVTGLVVAAALLGTPANVANAHGGPTDPVPLLRFAECSQASTATTTETVPNGNGAISHNNPSDATGAGSGCTVQAQVNTNRTLTVTFTINGAPVAGRSVDFTINNNETNPNQSANFPQAQPPGATADLLGFLVACTTNAQGQCSVNITDNEAEFVRVDAVERSTLASAYINVEFRTLSVAPSRLDLDDFDLVAPEGTNNGDFPNNVSGGPGRPYQLNYRLTDKNGTCNPPAQSPNNTATCTGDPLSGVTLTVRVDNAAYFTPNCQSRDISGSPSRSDANATAPVTGTDAQGNPIIVTPGTPSSGTLDTPAYIYCRFTPAPANGAEVGALQSLGQSITVVTDENGEFTVTVAEARDPGFDDDGYVNVTLTAQPAGSSTVLTAREAGSTSSATAASCVPNEVEHADGIGALDHDGINEGTNGCNSIIPFTTRQTALNGGTVDIVAVDGLTAFPASGAINIQEQRSRVFVVYLRDSYGNLTTDGAKEGATLTKTGVGTLESCASSTSTDPCTGSNGTGTPTVQQNGTTTQVFQIEGSFTNRSTQERFEALGTAFGSTVFEPGTMTVTAKWVAPVTTFVLTTTPPSTTPQLTAIDQSQTETLTDVVVFNFYHPIPSVTFAPATPSSTVPTGTVVTVGVTVLDQFGQPIENLIVNFFRSGSSNNCTNSNVNGTGTTSTQNTNKDGKAGFSFTCSDPSTQNITTIVTDGSGNELARNLQTVTFTGPLATGSAAPSATATAQPTAPPGPGGVNTCTAGTPGAVSLTSNVTQITAGNTPTLSGVARNTAGALCASTQITIFKKSYNETAYTALATVSTDANGVFTLVVRPLSQTAYGANTPNNAVRSNIVVIRVYTRINITSPVLPVPINSARPATNPVTFTGTMLPGYSNVAIGLGTFINGRFVVLTQTVTNSTGGYSITRTLPTGTAVYVIFTSAHQGTDKGSKSITLNVS